MEGNSKEITKAMRYEIIKPTNCTWEEFGKVLHDLLYKSARIGNYMIQLLWQWDNYRQQVKLETDKYPSNKEQPNYYKLLRERFPDVSPDIINQTRQWVANKYQKDRKDIFLLKKSIPSFRDNMPILVYNKAYTLRHLDNNDWEIDARLLPSDMPQNRFSFLIKTGEKSKRAILERIYSGEYKQGMMQIIRDKHKKWYAILSYTFTPKERELSGDRIMEVTLGNEEGREIVVTISGTKFERIIPVNDIKETMKRFNARLTEIKEQRKFRQALTKGHGREKLFSPAQNLQEKINNFKLTANHKLSKIIIDLAVKQNCSEIAVFGDFLDQWPVCDLKNKIKYKAEEQGIKFG